VIILYKEQSSCEWIEVVVTHKICIHLVSNRLHDARHLEVPALR
jgi:hypothetical protein